VYTRFRHYALALYGARNTANPVLRAGLHALLGLPRDTLCATHLAQEIYAEDDTEPTPAFVAYLDEAELSSTLEEVRTTNNPQQAQDTGPPKEESVVPEQLQSQLAGWANYSYCAAHSRSFWGLLLYLVFNPGRGAHPVGAGGFQARRTCPLHGNKGPGS
jgi:hypothetical protein